VTYFIEYLGEFKLIFETILDYESGDQMGSFDVKKPPSKISCLGTFKAVLEIYSLKNENLVDQTTPKRSFSPPVCTFLSSALL
jgi:hypothetical protein